MANLTEILTEIPDIWFGISAFGSALGAIYGSYRSIIKKIEDGLEKLDTKMEAGFKESREALTSLETRMDTKYENLETRMDTKIGALDSGIRQEIIRLTTVVIGLAEKVGAAQGAEKARRPEEVPPPAERIAEAG